MSRSYELMFSGWRRDLCLLSRDISIKKLIARSRGQDILPFHRDIEKIGTIMYHKRIN